MSTASLNHGDRRFFIALVPPLALQEEAQAWMQALRDRYHCGTAKAPPHVTLFPPFLWPYNDRDRLYDSLTRFAQTQTAVSVTLKDFAAFPPRVLYVHVEQQPALMHLQASLAQHLRHSLSLVDAVGERRGFTPHLTIASRRLTRQTFRAAWAELKTASFDATFLGDRLTLLQHDSTRWHEDNVYPLEG